MENTLKFVLQLLFYNLIKRVLGIKITNPTKVSKTVSL